jgi:hypothetical protein
MQLGTGLAELVAQCPRLCAGELEGLLATLGAPRPLTAPPSTSTAPLGREGDAFSAWAENLV